MLCLRSPVTSCVKTQKAATSAPAPEDTAYSQMERPAKVYGVLIYSYMCLKIHLLFKRAIKCFFGYFLLFNVLFIVSYCCSHVAFDTDDLGSVYCFTVLIVIILTILNWRDEILKHCSNNILTSFMALRLDISM